MILDREWEKFKGGPTVASQNQLHVTLGRKGVLYINGNTHRLLGRPTGVYLFFNRAKDTIAVQPASPRLPEAFPVKEKREGYIIHASPFCRHFGIRLDTTQKFIRPDIDDSGFLILDLASTITVTRQRPKRPPNQNRER